MLSNQANKRIIIQHIYSIIAPKPWTNWKKESTQLRKKNFLTGKPQIRNYAPNMIQKRK